MVDKSKADVSRGEAGGVFPIDGAMTIDVIGAIEAASDGLGSSGGLSEDDCIFSGACDDGEASLLLSDGMSPT